MVDFLFHLTMKFYSIVMSSVGKSVFLKDVTPNIFITLQ